MEDGIDEERSDPGNRRDDCGARRQLAGTADMRACAAVDFVAYELNDKIAIDMPVTVTSPFTPGTVQLARTPKKDLTP